MFNLPTLVTLTAPTCSGKNHLLEEMVKAGFGRIVSTTDRLKREGEVEGVHYYFISTERSVQIEQANGFAELISYNNARYGVTKLEMQDKMADSAQKPPIVILEPQGVEAYRQYCGLHGYAMFTIYVATPEAMCLERLAKRTAENIIACSDSATSANQIHKIIETNNKRLKSIIEEERLWSHSNRWDVYATGTDTDVALEQIALGIKYRNSRSSIYQ